MSQRDELLKELIAGAEEFGVTSDRFSQALGHLLDHFLSDLDAIRPEPIFDKEGREAGYYLRLHRLSTGYESELAMRAIDYHSGFTPMSDAFPAIGSFTGATDRKGRGIQSNLQHVLNRETYPESAFSNEKLSVHNSVIDPISRWGETCLSKTYLDIAGPDSFRVAQAMEAAGLKDDRSRDALEKICSSRAKWLLSPIAMDKVGEAMEQGDDRVARLHNQVLIDRLGTDFMALSGLEGAGYIRFFNALHHFAATVSGDYPDLPPGQALQALLREPGLTNARYVDVDLAKRVFTGEATLTRELSAAYGLPRAWSKAIAAHLPTGRSGDTAYNFTREFPPLLENYPAKYLHAPDHFTATRGLSALIQFNSGLELMIDRLRVPDRHSSTIDAPDLVAAARSFVARAKSLFSTGDIRAFKTHDMVDGMMELFLKVVYPAFHLAGVEFNPAGRSEYDSFIRDMLNRLTFDELFGFSDRFHNNATLVGRLETATQPFTSWTPMAAEAQISVNGEPASIMFLQTTLELVSTGADENHCVGTYGPSCLYGPPGAKGAVTQIGTLRNAHGKIEATFEVRLYDQHNYEIIQIKGRSNADVPPAISLAVREHVEHLVQSEAFDFAALRSEVSAREEVVKSVSGKKALDRMAGYNVDGESFEAVYAVFRRLIPSILREPTGNEFIGRISSHYLTGYQPETLRHAS